MAMSTFQRRVLILGVCIAVLAGTYVLGFVFSPARVGRREAEAPLIAGFERRQRERVAEIRIQTGEGDRTLVKKGDSWILPGAEQEYPASVTRIDALLDFIADLARKRVVTGNPEAWEEFQVDSEAGNRILLLDAAGDELTEIIVGKSAAGGEDNYVRLGGTNETILTNRSFGYYLNVEERFWAYLRILPEDLDGESIMRITVDSSLRFGSADRDSDTPRYTLVLSSGQPAVWTIAGRPEVELDNGKVDLMADNLADLEGSEFAHGVGAEESGLSAPAARILFSTVDGKDYRLLIGGEAGDEQYYAALEDGKYVYKVAQWRVKAILKNIEDLRAEKAADTQQEQ
jgi:hypothetical protein